MEVRSITRSNTLSSLNKKAVLKSKATKVKNEDEKENNEKIGSIDNWALQKHPGSRFIRASTPSLT